MIQVQRDNRRFLTPGRIRKLSARLSVNGKLKRALRIEERAKRAALKAPYVPDDVGQAPLDSEEVMALK